MRRATLKLPASFEFALASNGHFLAALGRNVVVADLTVMRRVSHSHPMPHPSHADFSRDGALLAVKGTSGEIVVIDTRTGDVRFRHDNAHEGEGSPLQFAGDGAFLVDGSWDGYIRVRDALSPTIGALHTFPGEMIRCLSASEDRSTWIVCHQPCETGDRPRGVPYVTTWRWPLSAPSGEICLGLENIYDVEVCPSGERFAVLGSNQLTRFHKLSVHTLAGDLVNSCELTEGGYGRRVRWARDGQLLAVVQSERFAIYDRNLALPPVIFDARYPSDIALPPGAAMVALGTWEAGLVRPLAH